MADIYASFPPTIGPTHVPVYANFAAFPSAASAGEGAEGFALDSSTLYVSDGSAWQAVGGAGSIGIGTFDSGVASAQGAHVDAGNLIMQSASATVPGLVNTGAQTLAGAKTLSSAPVLSSLTASRALTVDASKVVTVSTTSDTELGYVTGVTSAIQTQLDGKQATLTIGNLTDVGTDGIVVTGGTGAVIGSGTSLAQHVSDSTHNGYLSSTDWSTFNGKQAALTIGNLTDVGTDGITVTGGTGAVIGSGTAIAQHVADATHNGYLSSTDWSTFNGKQASGNYITALTGDVTASGPGSVASTVAKIAGTAVSGTTGSVNVVFSTSPALTTPDIGTPTAGVLTNCTGLPIAGGGTGQTTANAAFNALAPSQGTNANKVLVTNATNTSWALVANANVDAAAAIAYSKLTLTGAIVNADVSASAAIAGSKLQAASNSNAGTISKEVNSTFTAAITGLTTAPTDGWYYNVSGKILAIFAPADLTGTSNSTAMTITGYSGPLPVTDQTALCYIEDSGSTGLGRVVLSASNGTLTFTRFNAINNITSFTASGTKGVTKQVMVFTLN